MKQTARGMIVSVNLDKTGFKCFNQDGTVFLLKGKPLKLIWFGLVSLFNDISTFVGYLMAKSILREEQ